MNAKSMPGSRKGNANKMALHVRRRDPMHRVESTKMILKLLGRVLYKTPGVGVSEGV
jgi:hypothetical protein